MMIEEVNKEMLEKPIEEVNKEMLEKPILDLVARGGRFNNIYTYNSMTFIISINNTFTIEPNVMFIEGESEVQVGFWQYLKEKSEDDVQGKGFRYKIRYKIELFSSFLGILQKLIDNLYSKLIFYCLESVLAKSSSEKYIHLSYAFNDMESIKLIFGRFMIETIDMTLTDFTNENLIEDDLEINLCQSDKKRLRECPLYSKTLRSLKLDIITKIGILEDSKHLIFSGEGSFQLKFKKPLILETKEEVYYGIILKISFQYIGNINHITDAIKKYPKNIYKTETSDIITEEYIHPIVKIRCLQECEKPSFKIASENIKNLIINNKQEMLDEIELERKTINEKQPIVAQFNLKVLEITPTKDIRKRSPHKNIKKKK